MWIRARSPVNMNYWNYPKLIKRLLIVEAE